MSDEHLISLGKKVASVWTSESEIFNHLYLGSKIQEMAKRHLLFKCKNDPYECELSGDAFLYEVLDLIWRIIGDFEGHGYNTNLKDKLKEVLSTDLADYISLDDAEAD